MSVVPNLLRGAWRRRWIRFADGAVDDTSIVVWLQFERDMVDVRFAADRAELAHRKGLDNCDLADVLRLADSDSSSGYTTCTDVVVDDAGIRTATAEWHSPVNADSTTRAVSFQPFTSFPEPGLLEWNADGTVMIERAPSGEYVEEWHLVAGTAGGDGSIEVLESGMQRFTMGPVVVDVLDNRSTLDRSTSLLDQIHSAPSIAAARMLVDCVFTLAELDDNGNTVITASTHPWRIGDRL